MHRHQITMGATTDRNAEAMMTPQVTVCRAQGRICRKGSISARSSLLVAVLLFAVSSAWAQTWSSVGPPGGTVRDLAHDPRNPDRVYLGTADGILYRSDDGGVNWSRLDPGFPKRGMSLDDIAVDTRSTVYVGYREVSGNNGGVNNVWKWSPAAAGWLSSARDKAIALAAAKDFPFKVRKVEMLGIGVLLVEQG